MLKKILLFLALLAMPGVAHAGEKLTAVEPIVYQATGSPATDAKLWKDTVAYCVDHNFNTSQNLQKCLADGIAIVGEKMQTVRYVSTTYFYLQGGTCTPYYAYDADKAVVNFSTELEKPVTFTGKRMFVRVRWQAQEVTGSPSLFTTKTCTTPLTSNLEWADYRSTTNAEAGTPSPYVEQKRLCKLPPLWLKFYPTQTYTLTDGYFMPKDMEMFQVQINSGLDYAYTRSLYGPESINNKSMTPPGAIYSVAVDQFGQYSGCKVRRFQKLAVAPDNSWQVFSVQILNGIGSDQEDFSATQSPTPEAVNEIVVTAERKSKPAIPYLTPKQSDGYVATEKGVIAMAQAELARLNEAATQEELVAAKMVLKADWSNRPTDKYHPSPENLARDNPDCAANVKPECAWKEASTPVNEDDKPNELVRLSNDGQTVVTNNTTTYNNTIYPPAMVAAGNAPDNTDGPGSPGNPEDGEDVDGDAAAQGEAFKAEAEHFGMCYEDPGQDECSDGALEAAIGDRLKAISDGYLGSPASVGESLVNRAMATGDCQLGETSVYCSMVGSLGMLDGRGPPAGAEIVLWEGQFRDNMGKMQNRRIAIPASMVAFFKSLLFILLSVTGFKLLIGWRD